MVRSFAVLALFAPAPLFAEGAPKAGTPVAGVGVVSTDAKLVFVPAKGGGIEALDLATGKPVWKNADAPHVAGASAKQVYAWLPVAKKANEFTVVAIDAETGKTIGKAGPVLLPEWAVAGKTYGRTFATSVRADGDSALVAWTAGAFYAGGARPTPEIEAAARKNDSGLAKLDFATGKATPANGRAKPDDMKFGPAASAGAPVAGLTFGVEEQLPGGFKPGALTTVTLTAFKDDKKLWARELAGNPFQPPPP
jgi:DNA-binding beta-propeller fold protein YncE